MRLRAHDRYQNDAVFARIVDTLRIMLETEDEYAGRQFTPTEMREAAMLACELYEYQHVRPILLLKSTPFSLAMFGGAEPSPKTATGAMMEDWNSNDKAHR